ncbi:MAG: ankyrin repeat domain-containing protein, partial [Candidatus Brocadiae bacterium]|nr:ankyrin repeat domain-containing protein [Candidatus Brocadiia bacterium]
MTSPGTSERRGIRSPGSALASKAAIAAVCFLLGVLAFVRISQSRLRTATRRLYHAAALGDLRLAKELLAKGADPNAPNPIGDTPLDAAAGGGHYEIAEALMARGADVNL